MNPPSWFLKQLTIIDKTYFPVWNEHYAYWEIKKRMEIARTNGDTGHLVNIKDPTLAIFNHLNDNALLTLRRRKYNGLMYHRKYSSTAYLDHIVRANRIAKKKMKEIAHERMAEGFMKMYDMSRKKMFT